MRKSGRVLKVSLLSLEECTILVRSSTSVCTIIRALYVRFVLSAAVLVVVTKYFLLLYLSIFRCTRMAIVVLKYFLLYLMDFPIIELLFLY